MLEQLYEIAPVLYSNKTEEDNSFKRFGFECGEGWFELLKDLSIKLEPFAKRDNLEVLQVKSKFDGLRFYVGKACQEAHDLIGEAEAKSYKIPQDV